MPKYHINPETQRPNLCNPVKTGKCKYGSVAEHFESKEDAKLFIEKSMANAYAQTSSVSKKTVNNFEEIFDAFDTEDSYHSVYAFFGERLPDAQIERTIEQIDYRNEVLFTKDGEYYMGTFYGGDWIDLEPTGVHRVEEQQVLQQTSTLEHIDTLSASEIAMMKDLDSFVAKAGTGSTRAYYSHTRGINFSGAEITYTREDGSQILTFPLTPEGDSTLADKPTPVAVDIDLHENGERQNSRMYESAHVVFDTKTNSGVAFVWQSGSEGGGKYDFERDAIGNVKPEDEQRMYRIMGTGEEINKAYWLKKAHLPTK